MTRFLKRFIRIAMIVAAAMIGAPAAHADCTADTPSSAAFGAVTSLNVAGRQQSTSSPKAGLSCVSTSIGFGSTDVINGTITTTNNGRLKGPTGDTIGYALFSDKNFSRSLNIGQRYNWADSSFFSFPGLDGGAASLPLYLQTVTGSNVAAGTYVDTIVIAWQWELCRGVIILGNCVGGVDTGATQVTIPVTLTVTNDCTIVAPDVSFGTASTVSGFSAVSGALSLTCTKGMVYTVGLSPGNQAAANGRRQMANGSSLLQYDLYAAGTGLIWGQATNRVAGNGAADGVSAKQFPYVARIYTDQPTPPPGTYTDSVIVDVRY